MTINWTKIITSEQKLAEAIKQAKIIKNKEINLKRDELRDKPISYSVNGQIYHFQRDFLSQLSFLNASQTMNEFSTIQWITAENSIVEINRSDIVFGICKAIRDKDTTLFVAARIMKDEIDLLNSVDEISNYQVNFDS